jgi:uncharacterized protein YbjT (DUF2867 family)
MKEDEPRILVTGATGYVGGRLLEALEHNGHAVRCMARRPEFLAARVGSSTSVVPGDCLDASTLGPALSGIETAFYLVHSMGTTKDFEEQDRIAALNFATAAKRAGVRVGSISRVLADRPKYRHGRRSDNLNLLSTQDVAPGA